MATPIERQYILLGLKIAGDFGATIALPVVLLVFLGKMLDARFGTSPLMTIGGFVLAAVCSGVIIRKKALRYGQAYQALIDSEKTP